jgi:mediator of RNA polymerase II transcription subunit 12
VEPQGVYRLDNSFYQQNTPIYPDFAPWKHTPKEDEIALSHLQKGYFEPPHVSNELLSARNIIYQLLRCDNSLNELSTNLRKSIDVRSANNKITQSSYKPPPRVTLTDQKREAWLKDLANNDVPLRKLSRTIPHGVRHKVLIEHCINKNIPMNRAIWFVRCVGTNELRGLKRKGGANFEFTWIQEWTIQVVEFIEKISASYLKFETFQQATDSWKLKISYLLRFISNLYIENLIEREGFLSWINKFFKNCKSFEVPLALTIIKAFWNEIIKVDYLVKDLTEVLILRFHRISSSKNMLDSKGINVTDSKLNDRIKSKISQEISNIITESFNHSIDNFIIPNSWSQLRPILKTILKLDNEENFKKFELISYRNDSLMINSSSTHMVVVNDMVAVLDSFKDSVDFPKILDLIITEDWKENIQTLISWSITKYRCESYRILLVVKVLKKLKQPSQSQHLQITAKEISQTILDYVFELHKLIDVIDFTSLFILLNHLTETNLFKTSIYIRRLISSGFVYLSDNPDEKLLHGSILKNLKPQKSSQTTMILKNLDSSFQETVSSNVKLKYAMEILEKNALNEMKNLNYLNKLEVGMKLKLSDLYLQSILSKGNLFPLLTYKEFKDILHIFNLLNDKKNLVIFLIKALESAELDSEQLELVALLTLSHTVTLKITGDLKNIVELLIEIQKVSNSGCTGDTLRLNSFWNLIISHVDEDHLKDEINSILLNKQIKVNNSSVIEKLNQSGLDITLDKFLGYENFHSNFHSLIRLLFNETSDMNRRKCVVGLFSVLKDYNVVEFNKTLFVFIKKTYTDTNELFRTDPLYDLIVSELISIKVIVETFLSFNSSVYTSFVMDLLFKEISQPETYDFFKLSLLREQFKKENPQVLLKLMKLSLIESDLRMESIQSDSTELINSLLTDNTLYRSEFLTIFLDNLIHNRELIIDTFLKDGSSSPRFISLLNETLLLNGETGIEDEVKFNFVNLLKNLKNLNKFNLPIFQMLFKLSLSSEISAEEISQIFELGFSNINIDGNQNLFGSLFELLDPDLKVKFVHHLEALFLNSKNFPGVTINNENVSLKIISDILTTLSRGSLNIGLTDQLVFSLDVCLESLLKIVSQAQEMNDLLHNAISLFLKIIIIHKSFIIGIIIERNSIKESFLNNIVNLLNTVLVSSNLQLKNLLYDLLTSIKSSVNEMNINQSNNIKLPISMLNLPAISSKIQSSNNRSTNRQNLHFFNMIGNFVLYQRSSSSYHDFSFKSFDLLEDSNPIESINDTAINLQLFEASLERKNPGVPRA